MTASKVRHESKVILDLSKERLSKNKVYKLLRETEILTLSQDRSVYINNSVKVGVYNIRLILNGYQGTRLKNYGKFGIRLYQGIKEVNLRKDCNFKDNDWAKKNSDFSLNTSDLVSAILYCKRLDRLHIFN